MKLSSIINEIEASRLMELDVPMPAATTSAAPGIAGATGDPQAAAKMQAQQALDRAKQKKQLQDAIKQKQLDITNAQKELADMQKQLATIK